jgi:hypothetical protein
MALTAGRGGPFACAPEFVRVSALCRPAAPDVAPFAYAEVMM